MESGNKKVLYIEDDPILSVNVTEILEAEGFKVKTEMDGQSGIATALSWNPDLILCDISIPVKDGYQVLNEINSTQSGKNIPFIFLTAKVTNEEIRKGMKLGADDYIFKPFEINDLLTSIKLRFEKKSLIKDFRVQNNIENIGIDYELLFIDVNKSKKYKIGSIKYLCSRSPYVFIKFNDGKSALHRKSMDQWETFLPEKFFIRIHRSMIINMNYISAIDKHSKASYTIKLLDEQETFTISKRYSAKIRARLKS